MDPPRRLIAGRYELTATIATGGMGTVFRAYDRLLDREVAVKLMRRDIGDQAAFHRRFALEARRTARFAHPNIVAIHDYGADGGDEYIVMELVPGADLRQLLQRQRSLSPERAARIAADVVAALHVAHRSGIIHRDIKPANILITPHGGVKLTDLGISQAIDDAHATTTGEVLGTVDYLSPEQIRGESAGVPADIYALGVVLFEMLTGRRPFGGESRTEVALRRLSAEAPDPRSVDPDIPASLAAIVRRCLARDPDQRYRSARGLGQALRAWLARHGEASATSVATERQSVPVSAGVVSPVAAAEPASPANGPSAETVGRTDVVAVRPARTSGSKRSSGWVVAAALLVVLVGVGFAGGRWLLSMNNEPRGEVGGVVASPTLVVAEATATPSPSPRPTLEPTPRPTPVGATPSPAVVQTPTPATPVPSAPSTPEQSRPPIVVASRGLTPSETVVRFYSLVADGSFNAAYALWSDRMKVNFPRAENLDQRFDDTASITMHRRDLLYQDAGNSVVGVEFTERYDGGAWRRFDGSWELVKVNGEWLLDWPHF